MRLQFIISVLGILASCSTAKQKTIINISDNDSRININYSESIMSYVNTIDLNKLCDPVKLFVLFSVDSTGRIYDSEFKSTILSDKNCTPDSIYLNSIKIQFENQMPLLKVKPFNDSIEMIRYSIPITFD